MKKKKTIERQLAEKVAEFAPTCLAGVLANPKMVEHTAEYHAQVAIDAAKALVLKMYGFKPGAEKPKVEE